MSEIILTNLNPPPPPPKKKKKERSQVLRAGGQVASIVLLLSATLLDFFNLKQHRGNTNIPTCAVNGAGIV